MDGNQIWVKKYRPDTLNGYVFKDDRFEKQMNKWIDERDNPGIPIPNLLFVGRAGCGKTTAAKILINCLDVQDADVLEINASRENNVDTIRHKVQNFCAGYPFGKFKIVLMEECDGLTLAAQNILRAEIERFEETVRFIGTANNKNKFTPAIISRFQVFDFETLDMEQYLVRMCDVLESENVTFSDDDIVAYVEASYPDLRKGLNLVQQNTIDNVLQPLDVIVDSSNDYLLEAVELFRKNEYIKARKMICSKASVDEYDSIYRFFYQNLHIFSDDEMAQCQALIVIKNGLVNHALVADPEINLAATIAELSQINAE